MVVKLGAAINATTVEATPADTDKVPVERGGVTFHYLWSTVKALFVGVTGDQTIAGKLSISAATAATHAAQVSAIDATTGRLALGGKEIGDTGWREVPPINGWTADLLQIRRVGNIVFLKVAGLDGGSATSPGFLAMPGGFAGILNDDLRNAFIDNDGGETVRTYGGSSWLVAGSYTAVTALYAADSMPVAVSWPTSLPGTAT